MTEAIRVEFRATRHMRKSVQQVIKELREQGLSDSDSMSQYIRFAIIDKVRKDRALLDK